VPRCGYRRPVFIDPGSKDTDRSLQTSASVGQPIHSAAFDTGIELSIHETVALCSAQRVDEDLSGDAVYSAEQGVEAATAITQFGEYR
jgi:hypothetical protein